MGVRRRVVAVRVLMSALALPGLAALPGRASIRRQLPPTAAPRTDWPTFHYSLDRRGVNPAETLISARTAPKLALDWSAPVGGDIGGSPLVVDGIVYATSFDGAVQALDAGSGEILWTTVVAPGETILNPAMANGTVYVGTGLDNEVVALDAADGAVVWSRSLGGSVDHGPAVDGSVLFIGSGTAGRMYALDAFTGETIWPTAV